MYIHMYVQYMCSPYITKFGEVSMEGLDTEAVSGLTMKEVKQVLNDIAWREVREV